MAPQGDIIGSDPNKLYAFFGFTQQPFSRH